jgi:hypothetical protein
MFRIALVGVALTLAALSPRAASAAGWHYYDPECPVSLASKGEVKTMKFVAMQPKKNIDRVCDALPETGSTVIALDAADNELRDMNWDIRVLRDSGREDGAENVEADTVARVPLQKFRNGMANFDHDFATAGKYMLLMRMKSEDGAKEYIGRHRFTVGLIDNTDFYAYVGFGGFLAAAGGAFAWITHRKRKSVAVG